MNPVSQYPVVLLGRMYHPEGEQRLRAAVVVEVLEQPTPGQVNAALRKASGAFVRYPNKLRAEAIAGAEHLRIISTSGRGTDAIDIAAATARGVPVVNNPARQAVRIRADERAPWKFVARAQYLCNQAGIHDYSAVMDSERKE